MKIIPSREGEIELVCNVGMFRAAACSLQEGVGSETKELVIIIGFI